jgi:hypothetical protein
MIAKLDVIEWNDSFFFNCGILMFFIFSNVSLDKKRTLIIKFKVILHIKVDVHVKVKKTLTL